MMTPTHTQTAFAARHGFTHNPSTGTYTARAKWAGRSGWLEVSVYAGGFTAAASGWCVGITDEDHRGVVREFPTAREAWVYALRRLSRVVRLSGRELLPA